MMSGQNEPSEEKQIADALQKAADIFNWWDKNNSEWALEAVAARRDVYKLNETQANQFVALEIIKAAVLEEVARTTKFEDLDAKLKIGGLAGLMIGAFAAVPVHNQLGDNYAFAAARKIGKVLGNVAGHGGEDFRTRPANRIGKVEKNLVATEAAVVGLATIDFIEKLDEEGRESVLKLIESSTLFDRLTCADGRSFKEAGYVDIAKKALEAPAAFFTGVKMNLKFISPDAEKWLKRGGEQWRELAQAAVERGKASNLG